jgi:hypothetical protein
VQMARELGLNPTKLGKIANHQQESWKVLLPDYIEFLYEKQFGRSRPSMVRSIEEMAEGLAKKKAARREARKARREQEGEIVDGPPDGSLGWSRAARPNPRQPEHPAKPPDG